MKTVVISEEDYAVASGRAMKKFVEEAQDGDEKLYRGMSFLIIQGLVFDELFRNAKEAYDA